jgi:hypothetical protein
MVQDRNLMFSLVYLRRLLQAALGSAMAAILLTICSATAAEPTAAE